MSEAPHPPPSASSSRLLVGLSGCSASGKTTVARLVREILPIKVAILHQDDFFLPEDQLPMRSGLVDWDSAESLDIEGMGTAMRHLQDTGTVPPGFASKEDRNAVGPSGVSDETVRKLKEETERWVEETEARGQAVRGKELFIVDGFLMFGESVMKEVGETFDIRLLLRASYERAKQRRESRAGYATIEGFWTDPPGYFDNIVWPRYVEEHCYMFQGGDVEGELNKDVLERIKVDIVPGGGDLGIEQLLIWVLSKVKAALVEPNRSGPALRAPTASVNNSMSEP